jgi:hypothetical protein
MPPFTSVLPPMTTHHANNHANKNKRRRKQSSHMEQFQRSRNPIIKITWIRSIQYSRVIMLQHGSRRQKGNIRISKHDTKQRCRIMAQIPLSHLPPYSDQFNLLLATDSRSKSTPFHPNSPSSLLNHPFLFPTC